MTTKVITVTPALRAIQRKLERAELEHLRQHASDLATRLEMSEERAQQEAANADSWREFAQDLQSELHELALAAGETIGLTKTGEVGLIEPEPEHPAVAIGEQWPGTDAIYAGISLSSDSRQAVHLILWPEADDSEHNHPEASDLAANASPEHGSHLPTRIQAITLYQNLKAHFAQTWHWTSEKTESGKAAFIQYFNVGDQLGINLSAECRVRAVSEIPL